MIGSLAKNEPLNATDRSCFGRYGGQFVAIYGGRAVGRDKDAKALAERLFARLGDVPFFIARVEKQPSVYDLPSPELGD